MDTPTKEGKKRYPPDGVYTGGFSEKDSEFWEICTCLPTCHNSCKGQCGCKACKACYADFLSAR